MNRASKQFSLLTLGLLVLLGGVTAGLAAGSSSVGAAWVQRVDGSGRGDDQANAITHDTNGDVFVAGAVFDGDPGAGGSGLDYEIVKYSGPTGAVLWSARYNGSGNGDDVATAIATDSAGHVWVTGYAFGGAPETGGSSDDIVTLEYDAASGTLLNTLTFSGPGNGQDRPAALAVDSGGNVFVGGTAFTGPDTQLDYVVLRYGIVDGQNWVRYYDGSVGGNDQLTAIVVDTPGNVYATGASYGGDPSSGGTNFDYATVSFAADGTRRWAARQDGPVSGFDKATSIAVAPSGDVIVHGFVTGPQNFDYLTVRYTGASGAVVWATEYDNPASVPDVATGVAVNGSGDVYATGFTGVPPFQSFETLRIAGGSGTVQWVRTYSGPAGFQSVATALAVDSSGSPYVCGFSFGPGSAADYATLKYSSSGVLAFEGRYNNVPSGDDRPTALTVGANGDVWVTGNSSNGANLDLATIRYATADHPPVASAGPDQTIECGGSLTTVSLDGSGSTDADLDPLTYTWSEDGNDIAVGVHATVSLPAGRHVLTLTVTDGRGGIGTATVNVNIADTEIPSITPPAAIVVANDPGSCSGHVTVTAPAVADNCGTPSLIGTRSDGAALTDPYPGGVTTITWTATDQAGNSSTALQTVNVLDHEAPTILCPSDITVVQNFPGGAPVAFEVQATDNCTLDPRVVATPSSGTLFRVGTTTVTCTATDDAGNSSNCTFHITVTPPVSTPNAHVVGSGQVTVGGSTASFTVSASVAKNGKVKGSFSYREKRGGRTVKSTALTGLQVSGSKALLYGSGKDEHRNAIGFAATFDTSVGARGGLTVALSDGYTVGPIPITSGTIRIH